MFVDTICAECGETTGPGVSCAHCNAPLINTHEDSEPGSIEFPSTVSASGTRNAQLNAMTRHPGYAAAMAHEPDLSTVRKQALAASGCMGVFGLFPIAFAVVAFTLLRSTDAPLLFTLLFLLVPLAMVAIVVLGVVKTTKKRREIEAAPTVRLPCIIRDEREQVSTSSSHSRTNQTSSSRTSTSYFATLESAGGERKEYRIEAELAGSIAPGDTGVAYLRADMLIEFRRLEL